MTLDKCTLTIDLNIIKNNYQVLQKICPVSELGAAVKANCYGLGVDKIAPMLEKLGCKNFFVASKDEALHLRNILAHNSSNIYILNGDYSNEKEDFFQNNLIPVLNSLPQAKTWETITHKLGKKLPCAIHLNTGMNRLGVHALEVPTLQNYDLNVCLVMSHLSSAEDKADPANEEQLALFKKLSAFFPHAKKSFANSSGIFLGQKYCFDIMRPGGALYGINPAPYLTDSGIKNPVTLEAPIIQINSASGGEYVGYNRTHKLGPQAIVATLPLGYADGYMRSLSNKGVMYIGNKEVKVIGRVSMDFVTIDVTHILEKDLFLGQSVEIIGPNITPDKIANLAGTNAYEILTSLGNRYNRVYD
jgi:alanine racemase